MNTCPKCKDGKMNVRVTEYGKSTTTIELNCVSCDGTGQVSDEKLKEIKDIDRFVDEEMCDCEDPTFGSYPEDGECSCGMYKHHVHCGTCGKISQIG